MWKSKKQKKSLSLKSQMEDDIGAVVASSAGGCGRNCLDRRDQRGRAGKGRRREGTKELGAERERERERREWRGRGKERAGSSRSGREREKGRERFNFGEERGNGID